MQTEYYVINDHYSREAHSNTYCLLLRKQDHLHVAENVKDARDLQFLIALLSLEKLE